MPWITYDKEKEVWIDLPDEDKKDKTCFYVDGIRRKYLDRIKKDLKNDMDHCEIITGAVGSGKSTLGRLDCRYVSDENFHPRTHIVKDVADISPVFKKAKTGEAVLIDEGSGIYASTDTTSKKTKFANYILDVCRQNNLLIVILCPYFHRLTTAVACDGSKTMTRVYLHDKTGKRGRFSWYGEKLKEKLYMHMKKNFGSLKGIKPKYRGKFSEDKTFTQEYKKVKDETLNLALDSFNTDKNRQPTVHETIADYKKGIIKNNIKTNSIALSEMLGISARQIDRIKSKVRKEMSVEI